MPSKRKWNKWPNRTMQELGGVPGIAGLGGIAIGAGGMATLAGTAALTLTGVGTFIVIGAIGYAIVKSFPERIRHPQELLGHTITIKEINEIEPKVKKLGIIGIQQAGKTTLKERLLFASLHEDRTQKVSALIVSLNINPPKYYALLDGGGEIHSQQYTIALASDCLCIVLDHNISHSESAISDDRLLKHKEFFVQVRHHLDEEKANKKVFVEFLINKHDLWSHNSEIELKKLIDFCLDEVRLWKDGLRAEKVGFRLHSNDSPIDIAKFVDFLKVQS